MADEIKIPIKAIYEDKEAKQALADAKAIDKADPELQIKADSTEAKKSVDDLLAKADKLASAPASILLGTNAAEIAIQIAGLISDLDKLDANEPTIDVKSAQINALTADLDKVQTKIREINATPIDVDSEGLTRVGESAKTARSALSNFAGNVTQEIPGLSSSFAPINQAMSEMVEGFSEGDISLKEFAKGAGIAAGAGIALDQTFKAIAEHQKRIADSKAFDAKQVTEFKSALEGADTVLKGIEAKLRSDAIKGGIEANFGPLLGRFDLTEQLTATGLKVESMALLLQGGKPQIDAWAQSMKAAGVDAHSVNAAVIVLNQQLDALGKGEKGKAVTDAFLGVGGASGSAAVATGEFAKRMSDAATAADAQAKRTEEDAKAIEAATEASEAASAETDQLTTALEGSAAAAENSAKQHQNVADALGDEIDAMFGMGDATRSAEKAEDNFADAAIATAKAIKEHGKRSEEATQATEAETDAAIDAAKAQAALAKQQSDAAGKTQTNAAKVDTMNQALLNQANFATPQARSAIADYINEANQVPPDKTTDIKAAIVAGDFDTAKRLLDEASAARTAAIIADAETTQAEKDLEKAARDRIAKIIVQAVGTGAALGLLPKSTPAAAGTTFAAPTVYTTINLPAGARGVDALREISGATRRVGTRYGSAAAHARR